MLTAVEIFEEYAKCLDNPIYAIETYLQTFDKTQEGFVPFKLFVRQKEIVRAYEKHRFNLVTKPRQAGISTTTQGYCAIKIGFADPNNPETIIVIANKLTLAKKFLKGIKDYVNQLPRWVWGNEYYGDKDKEKKSIFVKDSQIEVELPNGSRIIAVATSEDALRGYTPTFLIFDEAAFIDRGADLYAAAVTSLGTGGRSILISCVTKDSFVFTDDGIKQISSLIDENNIGGYNVPHYNIRGLDKYRHSNIMFNNGLQDTIKIKTQSSELEGTHTHKVWAYSYSKKCYDWFAMSELEIGDSINIQHGFELWGNNDNITLNYNFSNKEHKPKIIYDKIDTNLAYLIGLYISEGSCYKPKNKDGVIIGCDVTITCGDYIGDWITNAGFTYSAHDNLHYKISNKYFGALLESLGFDLSLKAKEKYIPERLLSMSRENIIAMLQGIMDGDGYSDAKRGRVGIRLASEKMIKQIRALFLNFGILTEYNYGIGKPSELVKVHSNYYNISATSSNAKKYYDLIGFRFNRKQIKQTALDKIKKTNSYYFIPDGKNIIRNILDENKLVRKLSNTGLKVNTIKLDSTNKTHDLNIKKFNEFIDYFINVLNLDLSKYELDKILLNNGRWEHIKSIDYSQNETYDFSLPNDNNDFWCHSIVYNGILGHQTPNGYDPLYYKTYEQAKRGENTYNIIELKWYEDPRYNKDLSWTKNDETVKEYEFKLDSYAKRIKDGWKPASSWYINMCKNMNNDKKKIAQELDVSFLGSGGNVIDDEYIDFHEKNNVTEPKYVDKTYYDGNSGLVWIWSEPIEGHEYIMACLPPNEKVLTNNGLKNIEDVVLTDKLINEYGNYVDIINKQTHSVVDEDVFEVSIDNTFRTTKFTKEHPILISKPILKRNYIKNNEYLKFNQRYWDFNFNYTKAENIEVGDWIKVPNIYNKEIKNVLDDKWVIAQNFRLDFSIESPLKDKDFWWFIGMWLGDGWLSKLNDSYSITICFDSKDEYYLNKTNEIITRLFGRSASFIDKGQNTFALVFNSKFLYHFILENFGQYSYGKKINEWVKFIPKEFKIELIKGYLASDGCWLKHKKGDKINSKVSFVSINLELLESIQDIIFSLGVISSLNKLRVGGESYIRDKIINQKDTYQLSLCNNDSVELINLLNNDNLDPKLNKFILSEFNIINKRSISSCHFNDNKDFIYFRVKHIDKTKYSGNVYNFECDTHTFMCHHITTHNCDVARGDGADYSCFQIIDFTTMEQVVEFQGKIPPDSFAEMLNIYGLKYDAFLIVDNIGVGNTTTSKLVELKYPNLYYDEKTKDNKVAGFNINGCRLQLISNLEIAIRTNTIKINSIRLIHEMKTYIYKNGRPDHMEGYNDDCLMSLGMALWILESSFKSLKKAKAQTKAILAGWTVGGSDGSTSTITTIDPISNKKVTKINPNHSAYRNVQDPNGDYMWLFSGMR